MCFVVLVIRGYNRGEAGVRRRPQISICRARSWQSSLQCSYADADILLNIKVCVYT